MSQTFSQFFDCCSFFVSSQYAHYFRSLTLLESENTFLSRELKASRSRVDLLQSFLNEQKKALHQSGLGHNVLETLQTTSDLRERIVSLEGKVERLLEGQVKDEVSTLQDQINKVVHLNDLDKQLKFSALSLKQMAAKEENKLPRDFVDAMSNNRPKESTVSTTGLSDNEVKAIRHHCQRLKKYAKTFEDRSALIQVEVRECIAGLLEHMENYQRLVQPVLPPKILTMMLQRSLQYYDRLKMQQTGSTGSVVFSSAMSVDSASLSFPTRHVEGGSVASMSMEGVEWFDDSETSSQVSQSTMPRTMTGGERILRDSAAILTDASKSLNQAKVKFGNIGSIPAAPERSHLTKRFDPPSTKRTQKSQQ